MFEQEKLFLIGPEDALRAHPWVFLFNVTMDDYVTNPGVPEPVGTEEDEEDFMKQPDDVPYLQ